MRLIKGVAAIGGVFVVLAVVSVSTLDYQVAQIEQNHYCEMVTAHKESGGERGWPDYKGNYEAACDGY